MSTDNTNLSLADLKAIVHKVKEESRREGYTDGAYDAVMAFCRAIGIPAIYMSRPSLWSTPIDRTRTLEEYTDPTGIEALEELRNIIGDVIEGTSPITVDGLFDQLQGSAPKEYDMPQSDIDLDALDQLGAFDV